MIKNVSYKDEILRACLLCLSLAVINIVAAQYLNIKNNRFWNTQSGHPIYSQGGGIFQFADPVTGMAKYYWYGVRYKEAEVYRNDPSVTLPNATFQSVTCYSSVDMVNWIFEGDVLTRADLEKTAKVSWVGRLGVAYIKEINQYALFVQFGAQVLVALSKTPVSAFNWHQLINMQPVIGTTNTGDQTVFYDSDSGKSYLIYSYGKGRNKIYISEIGVKNGKVGLLDCIQVFKGASREGNCMFKYKGKYYMTASNIYGWDASYAYYMIADKVYGPYKPIDEMLVIKGTEDDYAHITQTGFFVNHIVNGKETVIYCGDRWANFAGNGLGYNQWFPLSFDGDTPYFNSLSSWCLNSKTGEWKVGSDNNYVKNASFEADRNRIPSHVKPVQTELLGWHTEIIEGNKTSLDSTQSPVLNYFNTKADRKIVVGEKSLNITDKINFKRRISQLITSTPYVDLPDGVYTLTAMVRNTKGFGKIEMFAISNGKSYTRNIGNANNMWQKIKLESIIIKNKKAEIGFYADGVANAVCNVDDVSLIKEK